MALYKCVFDETAQHSHDEYVLLGCANAGMPSRVIRDLTTMMISND